MDIEDAIEKLDEEEQRTYSALLRRKRGYAGTAGFFLAVMPILFLIKVGSKGGDLSAFLDAMLITKIVGFLVLGFFAWRWSIIAAVGLLLWHLFFNTGYLRSPLLFQKISYFVFAVWIVIGIIMAVVRRGVLAKLDGGGELCDPRAERWLKIYRQRALATGDLPPDDFLRDCGIAADDVFWKQDNSNPSEGFAVNLDITYADIRRLPESEAHTITAEDDFGKHVPLIPILETGTAVKFDFVNASFELDAEGNQTPYEILKLQVELLETLIGENAKVPEGVEIGVDQSVFEDRISRLSWDANDEYWQVIFDYDARWGETHR